MTDIIDITTEAEPNRAARSIGRALLPEGSAGAVTHWYPTRWPRVGGKALLPLSNNAFTRKPFTDAYQPGKLVFIYVAGCGEDHSMPTIATGLLGLARRLRMTVHKVSVTAQVHLRDRLRELNADHYGALTTSVDGYPCSDLGYDNWMAQHILPNNKPLDGSPIALAERCLAVRLPQDLSVREFDKRLHHHMRNAALNRWLRSQAGRTHCQLIGIPPAQAMRATGYGFGEVVRASESQEFYHFRPKSFDADRLIRIAEVIIHDHVVAPRRQATTGWKSRAQGYGQAFH
ncbi:hypothetical protein [Bosea sp. TND4EK4]|uniref:hypothetical protein n=1 Tax=Bosea sp. TND4EK4 TaxID=1907408 RepID=UPI001115987D|nr:hypothetical protein [Bosea sp. TND4EK4]